MHSVTIYLQQVKETDAYINMVIQCINRLYMKMPQEL